MQDKQQSVILKNHAELFGGLFRRISGRKSHLILAVSNILLILGAVIFTVVYSRYNQEEKLEMRLDSFAAATESMKSISRNYLDNERIYARNWASYISRHDMTLDEALDFVKEINTQFDRYVHIVDMDTYEAYSSYEKDGSNIVYVYTYMASEDIDTNKLFLNNMHMMFDGDDNAVSVIGKYRDDNSQNAVISVGSRVTLRTDSGSRDYLLLRVIPIESMKKMGIPYGLCRCRGQPYHKQRSICYPVGINALGKLYRVHKRI